MNNELRRVRDARRCVIPPPPRDPWTPQASWPIFCAR